MVEQERTTLETADKAIQAIKGVMDSVKSLNEYLSTKDYNELIKGTNEFVSLYNSSLDKVLAPFKEKYGELPQKGC